MTEINTTPRRPYLLRAMHEWITDNNQTPYIIVDALIEGVVVPMEFVQDNKIILNISYSAANALELGNEWLMFQARFSGISQSIVVPVSAILGVYSKETGQGLIFEEEENFPAPPTGTDDSSNQASGHPGDKPAKETDKRSHLRVVK
jgi:stringent starvation protein B